MPERARSPFIQTQHHHLCVTHYLSSVSFDKVGIVKIIIREVQVVFSDWYSIARKNMYWSFACLRVIIFVINHMQGLQSLFFSYYPPTYKLLSLFARGILVVQGKGKKWYKIIIELPLILENPYPNVLWGLLRNSEIYVSRENRFINHL